MGANNVRLLSWIMGACSGMTDGLAKCANWFLIGAQRILWQREDKMWQKSLSLFFFFNFLTELQHCFSFIPKKTTAHVVKRQGVLALRTKASLPAGWKWITAKMAIGDSILFTDSVLTRLWNDSFSLESNQVFQSPKNVLGIPLHTPTATEWFLATRLLR